MRLRLLLLLATGFLTSYCRAGWVSPKTGDFWVLDSDRLFRNTRILLVHPATRTIVSSLETGYQADFALSRDGHYLYVASGSSRAGVLSLINTQTGQTEASTGLADRLILTGPRAVASIATSEDGSWIYVLGGSTSPVGVDEYHVDIFNRELSLAQQVPIPGCGVGFFETPAEGKVTIHCPLSNSIKIMDKGSAKPLIHDISLPIRSEAGDDGYRRREALRVSAAAFEDANGKFIAVMSDGESLDGKTPVVSLFSSATESQRYIPFRAWPTRDNGMLAFIGSTPHPSTAENLGLMDQVDVLSLSSLSNMRGVTTSLPFWSITVSVDGSTIYAICPANQTILQINVLTEKETNAFSGIGSYPLLMQLAP